MPCFSFLSLRFHFHTCVFYTEPDLERHENVNHQRGATGPLREKRCHKPHSPKKNVLVGLVHSLFLSLCIDDTWSPCFVALCMCSVYTRMPCIFNRDSMLQGNVSNGVTALSILAQVLWPCCFSVLITHPPTTSVATREQQYLHNGRISNCSTISMPSAV